MPPCRDVLGKHHRQSLAFRHRQRQTALDAILGSSGLPQDCGDDACTTQADATSPIDFFRRSLGPLTQPGYSIVGVAGTVAISTQGAAKTNIGVSLAVNYIGAANRATISGLHVTSTGETYGRRGR